MRKRGVTYKLGQDLPYYIQILIIHAYDCIPSCK